MDTQYPSHQGSLQGYSPTSASYGHGQRSISSPAASQGSGVYGRPFQPPVGGYDGSHHYGFSQPHSWEHQGEIVLQELQDHVTGSLDVSEINELSRSVGEAPWHPTTGRVQGFNSENHEQFWIQSSPSIAPRARTEPNPVLSPVRSFKRPSLPQANASYVSNADSGYYSLQTSLEILPKATQTETTIIENLPLASQNTAIDVPRRPPSAQTEPISRETNKTKPRKSKSVVGTCEECGKSLNNPSESTKHMLTHTKPFSCELIPCNRKEGFATKNDLERHRKAVHGACPLVGKRTGYVCQACPSPTPGSRPKWWPRMDNFKAHVKRKHESRDVEQLIKSSECEMPYRAIEQHGHASQPAMSNPPDDMRYQEWSSPIEDPTSRHASQQGEAVGHFSFDNTNMNSLAYVGEMGNYHFDSMREARNQCHGPRNPVGDGMTMMLNAAYQLASPQDSVNFSSMRARQSVPNIHLNGQEVPAIDEIDIEERSLKRPRTVSSASFSQETASSGHIEGEHVCPECGKIKKRECDLRKHMKRHTRPYGCTFAKCQKRFGSRNDWKRHENSQHFLSEMWRCDIKRHCSSTTRCGFLTHDQQQFAEHLHLRHEMKIGTEHNKKTCRDMHLGREGHHHFWCGFCNKLIGQDEGIQPGAWDVRFKHIGDHFDKHGQSIDDWIDIEQNRKKKLIHNEENRKLPAGKEKLEEDSDLGEDGIPLLRTTYEDVDADGVSDDEWTRPR